MTARLLILISFFTLAASLNAKSNSLKDNYAYIRGVEACNEGKYEDAMDWFNKEISDHPNNGYAFFYISGLNSLLKEYGKALTSIDNAIKNIPKKDKEWKAAAFASRSDIYATLGDTIKALNDLGQAIQIDPTNTKLFNARAQLNYELKNYDLSDTDYQKMINLDQGDVMGYMGIGRNAKTQKHWDEAIKQFNQVIKLSPDYSSGYSFRADAYIGLQKWAEATDDIMKALDIDGDDKAFYLMKTLPSDASKLLISKLKIQMAKQPTNRYWPYCIAIIASSNDDFEEAISYYEKANAIDANSVFLEQISKCYLRKDDFERALDYADKALAMSPEDYEVIELKANILSEMGRFDECLIERNRYVAKYPEYPTVYLTRADDLLRARRFKDAIEDYNTAIVLAPSLAEYPYLLMRRGDAYRFIGNNEKAIKDYELLLKVEADSILSAESWTPFAYTGLGNAEKAIETLQFILSNDTTDIKGTLYNAACVYARLGQTSEAIGSLKKAFENGYNSFSFLESDYDLDCLRDIPEYKELLKGYITKSKQEGQNVEEKLSEYKTEIVEIPFTKENGVTKVKCTINGLPLYFVFDTGAADVTLSMVEANFMLKNDYLKPTDIIGTSHYMDANGDISEGTIVNLRNVNFGDLELDNVRASVVRNQKAPLLLGQSVLGRLGKIEIDNVGMKLIISHKVSKK